MKKVRYPVFVVLVLALFVLALPAYAQAPEWNFVAVVDATDCGVDGWGALVQLERVNVGAAYYWDTIAESDGDILMDEIFQASFASGLHTWGIYDSNDRGLQTGSFNDLEGGAVVEVTITLRDTDGETILDQDTFTFVCGEEGDEEAVAEPTPGCDTFMNIPASAVGAKILADTPVYWKPGEMSDEVFPADLSVRAIGLDSTGSYYQVIFACGYYWVPAGVVGPNPEAPWNGAALPTDVVD